MLRQLSCCTLLFLAMQAGAQQNMPPPKGPPMDEIATAVGLKDNQRASVQAILEQHHAAMMALHQSMRGKQDTLDQQLQTNLAKVLTPTQLARFDQWQQTHRPPPPPDGAGGQGGGQGDRRGPPGGQGMGGQGGNGGRPPPPGGQYGQGGPGGQGGYGGPGGQGQRPPPPGGQYGQGQAQGQRPPPPPPGGDDYGQQPPPPSGGQP